MLSNLVTFVSAESETHRDIGIEPWAVGLIALALLLALLMMLLSFGQGREHS